MTDLVEVIFISEDNGLISCSAWDPKNGTNLMTYRGNTVIAAHTLTFIKNEHMVAASNAKPLLSIWPINNQEPIQNSRFVMPGCVTALAISPDGYYCVGAVSEVVYVWQICSGKMMATLSKHYQTITTIKFTDDGSHFVTSAKDGMILVWNLGHVISENTITLTTNPVNNIGSQSINALYTFSDHALPVTDIHIGKGGIRSYLVSVSLDRTCKIYDLASGTVLLNLVFPDALTSVIMDRLDTKLYVGTFDGHIYEFAIQNPPRTKEYHVANENLKNVFTGHKKAVTNLSISLDGETLLSGSDDCYVLLWHIPSKQTIRSFYHKGKITNAFFKLATNSMFNPEIKLSLIANNFKRMTEPDVTDNHIVEMLVQDKYDNDENLQNKIIRENTSINDSSELERLRNEVKTLKRINKGLFTFNVNCIFDQKPQ